MPGGESRFPQSAGGPATQLRATYRRAKPRCSRCKTASRARQQAFLALQLVIQRRTLIEVSTLKKGTSTAVQVIGHIDDGLRQSPSNPAINPAITAMPLIVQRLDTGLVIFIAFLALIGGFERFSPALDAQENPDAAGSLHQIEQFRVFSDIMRLRQPPFLQRIISRSRSLI
jgi:hypothetical protein